MAKTSKSNVWKLVVLSIIISLVVLAAFTAIFITMIVPAYNITREQVYSVLSKALPILIGLVLIEIGLMIGKNAESSDADTIDKLTPNAYDSFLNSKPVDDPLGRAPANMETTYRAEPNAPIEVKEVIKETPVEVVREVVKEVPIEVPAEEKVIIKEVEKPIEVKVPVEVIKEVQVPVEVIKEVPVEVVKEVVKEVPVEVIKEVVKEVPVEVIKEVPVEVEKVVNVEPEEIFYDFKGALDVELEEAYKGSYPISLVGFTNDSNISAKIERALGKNTLYFIENGVAYAILPFYTAEDASIATRLFRNKQIATQSGKRIATDNMIAQASRGLA